MADTIRGSLPNTPCSDCGEVGNVIFQHWGALVPDGIPGNFCGECMNARSEDSNNGRPPRPLGQKATVLSQG